LPYFKKLGIRLGLQNVFYENQGAYTGEVLPSQAKSMGIKYTLVGHSERREHLKETNKIINKKIKAALEENMGIVLCIGETLEEKTMMETEDALKRQIYTALQDINELKNIVIAYEPIWAIGSGKTPSKRELTKTIQFIKTFVKEMKNGEDIKVLYGGSVSEKNIETFLHIEEIDGFLVGGTSNNAQEFLELIEKVESFI
jgi:triosephosphate isomerase